MSENTCRAVEVDGETIRVLGGEEMDEESQVYFAEIVRAAKRRFASEAAPCPESYGDRCQGCDDPHCMAGKP